MIRRILVPLDGSKLAEGVLPEVKELAVALGAQVQLLQVLEVEVEEIVAVGVAGTSTFAVMEEVREGIRESRRNRAEDYLSGLASCLQAEGLDVSWEVAEGRAADKVVEFARSGGADLIAMSTHGRSRIGSMVFGVVAGKALREVGIPVLLVNPTRKR